MRESVTETQGLNSIIMELQTRVTGDHTRLNALESAMPERVRRCEEQQAYHIEILNGSAKHYQEQIATIQHRLNDLEWAPANVQSFGEGAQAQTQHFDIGSPISDLLANRQSVPPTGVPQSQQVHLCPLGRASQTRPSARSA